MNFLKRFYSSLPRISLRHYCLRFRRVPRRSQIATIKPREPSDGVIKVNVWHIWWHLKYPPVIKLSREKEGQAFHANNRFCDITRCRNIHIYLRAVNKQSTSWYGGWCWRDGKQRNSVHHMTPGQTALNEIVILISQAASLLISSFLIWLWFYGCKQRKGKKERF